MTARSLPVIFAFAFLLAVPARAQQPTDQPPQPPTATEVESIEPDRPDVTNGTHIVDVGLMQVEIGGVYSRANSTSHDFGTPTTIRVGLADWLELRIGGDGFLVSTEVDHQESGMGNIQVGAKLRLWAEPGGIPVLSILPTINLPAASESKGLGSGQPDYTVALLTGTDILTRGHLDVNYGIGSIGGGTDQPRFVQHLVSLSASAEIPGPFSPYVEGFWISRQEPDGGAVVAIDGGTIYNVGPRYALDGGMQIGLSTAAPSYAVFGGISVIVGNILGDHGVHARQRQQARRHAAHAGH